MTAPLLDEARTVRHLRYLAILGPLTLLVVVEIAERRLAPILSPWVHTVTLIAAVLAVLAWCCRQTFGRLAKLEQRLQRQHQELLQLHAAGLVVSSDLALETVLKTIVDGVRSLLGTRNGAISVVDAEGRITSFVTTGIALETIAAFSLEAGSPAGHPLLPGLLAAPVNCRVPYRGNLYVSEKDGGSFTADDQEALVRFADLAAVAIDYAYLYDQMRQLGAARERLRVAQEMHDGLAQVLAYVNTKAQVVREYLRQGKSAEAQEHLEEFAEAARGLYGDVRQQILDLRASNSEEEALTQTIADYLAAWRQEAKVEVELELPPVLELPPEVRRQLFRILREALANVRKHSRATKLQLAIHQEEGGVRLRVSDNGAGFDADPSLPAPNGRIGLKAMAERAEAIGGELRVHSRLGEGTCIEMRLPKSGGNFGMGIPDANTPGR